MTRNEAVSVLQDKLNNVMRASNNLCSHEREEAIRLCRAYYGIMGEIDGIKGRPAEAIANDYLADYNAGYELGLMQRPSLEE